MAEVVDLDGWEVLSADSSCKEEFEEDDFTYLDLERKGKTFDTQKKPVQFDYGEVMGFVEGTSSGENLVQGSSTKGVGAVIDPDYGKDCSDLARGYDEKDARFVRGDRVEEFVSSDNCDEHDSIGQLGFGEMEVLNEFYLNQIHDGTVHYQKDLNSTVFPFQGIDNSDSIFSKEPIGEILDWKSPKAIFAEARKEQSGFFAKGLNDINSGTNSSNARSFNLAKDPEEQPVSFDENPSKENEAETGSEGLYGAKGKKVLLAWWKAPMDVIKYYVFGVKPVWSISVAMGVLGLFMFSRKYYLYKMKQKDSKTQSPMKVRFDDKKTAMMQTRAARLNKAVSFIRPDPILRTPLPAFGVTMFPAMSSFQWAP